MSSATKHQFTTTVISLLLGLLLATSVQAQATVGVINHDESLAWEGYTLVSPFTSDTTFLIDNWGRVVHKWLTGGSPLKHAYLLPDGSLVKAQNPGLPSTISGGGNHGSFRKFSWDGTLLWDFTYVTDDYRAHHDIEPMPNGNVLMIAWEKKTEAELLAAGVDTSLVTNNELWPDEIIEVQQTGPTTGSIVWEWHMWDHLVQDVYPTKANYGVVADHPELINANELLGGQEDWAHINGVDYNPILDQIVLSTPRFNELWFIDHGTTTAEAAGHTGGARGMGGDLLYRWGNPAMYGRGGGADQTMYFQHDGTWIPPGSTGAGNVLYFSNRHGPLSDRYSTVREFVPAMNPDGSYSVPAFPTPFMPAAPLWSYQADPPQDFYGPSLSGAERLPNGNTLICNGSGGVLFEVTPAGVDVWRWVNPLTRNGRVDQGDPVTLSGPVFKCNRYAATYPAFAGRDLAPGFPIELGTARHVALTSPADAAIQLGPTPTFSWAGSLYSTEYRIQIAGTPAFEPTLGKAAAAILDVGGITGTTYTPLTALPVGTLHWRVQSSNQFGPGAWSETRSFATTTLPVELIAFDVQITGDSEVTLFWETASEKNNAGFAVEAQNSELRGQKWEQLVFVEGSGTTDGLSTYSYQTRHLEPGTWNFRLRQTDFDGAFEYFGPVSVEVEIPGRLWLASPYPNPFNPSTTLRFAVSRSGHARLDLFDVLGRHVRSVFAGDLESGTPVEVQLDATQLPSGTYMVRLEARGEVATTTVLVAK